jgi:arginase
LVRNRRRPHSARAGLIEALGGVGFDVSDLGDSPVVPWRPDRARPQAQNLEAVLNVVQTTANRVADALREGDRTVLVLGGDCMVGIGPIAGVRATQDDIAVAYFDLRSDLNTPASARDGALDWMALGHMLGLDGAEPTLVAATEKARGIGAPGARVPSLRGRIATPIHFDVDVVDFTDAPSRSTPHATPA